MPSDQSPAIAQSQVPLHASHFSESIYVMLLPSLLRSAMQLSLTFYKDCCTCLRVTISETLYILENASPMPGPGLTEQNLV
jgi:hypothetical protein